MPQLGVSSEFPCPTPWPFRWNGWFAIVVPLYVAGSYYSQVRATGLLPRRLDPVRYRAQEFAFPVRKVHTRSINHPAGSPEGVQGRAAGLETRIGRSSLHNPPMAEM